jgi:AhpD family alkylhydroperoxidase
MPYCPAVARESDEPSPWLGYRETAEATSDPDLGAVYEEIMALRGHILNLYKVLGHQPEALRAFMATSRYVRDEAALPAQLRELAIVRTAQVLGVPYELLHHLPAARRAGISEEQLRSIATWQAAGCFSPKERAVLEYAEQVALHRSVEDGTMRNLRSHLSKSLIVDLALTVAWYHLCAALIGPLRVGAEDHLGSPHD